MNIVARFSKRHFLFSAGAMLVFAGLAKLLSAFGNSSYLTSADPLIGVHSRSLLLAVGGVELVVAGVCFAPRFVTPAHALVAWLAATFLVYRLGLWWIGWHKPCHCLGNLTDALHIAPGVADNVMKGVLAYLLIGSCLVLWSDWKRGKAPPSTGTGEAASQAGAVGG